MRNLMIATVLAALATATGALADPINSGQTLSGVSVAGIDSIYHVFGHPGDPGGDYGPDQPAVLITFGAGAGNVFTFNATGDVSCCGDSPDIPPDGGNSNMGIGGANGLSGLSGNTNIPLVGVFTTSADPFGGVAPAALSFDADDPTDLSPLLNQVFYIGDGHAGRNNASGAALQFLAPAGATHLYVGAIDAYSFGGTTGYYHDNNGAFSVDIHLQTTSGAPEPASWALLIAGFGGVGVALRGRLRPAPSVV